MHDPCPCGLDDLAHSDYDRPWLLSPAFTLEHYIGVPFDDTLSDMVDAITPDPLNVEIGDKSQRYFTFNLSGTANVTATVTSTASLRVEILDYFNNVLASGVGSAVALNLESDRYIVRVLPANGPENAPFDLRLQLTPP